MNIKEHLEIQASVQQWVDNFMKNYNISATEMTDALTKVLVNLKDKSILEYLTELTTQQRPQEEEVNDNH